MSDLPDITIFLDAMRAKIASYLHKETNTTWLVTVHRELMDYHFHMKTAFPKRFDESSRELPEERYTRISQSLSVLNRDMRPVSHIIDTIVRDASANYFYEKERLKNDVK